MIQTSNTAFNYYNQVIKLVTVDFTLEQDFTLNLVSFLDVPFYFPSDWNSAIYTNSISYALAHPLVSALVGISITNLIEQKVNVFYKDTGYPEYDIGRIFLGAATGVDTQTVHLEDKPRLNPTLLFNRTYVSFDYLNDYRAISALGCSFTRPLTGQIYFILPLSYS